MLPPFANHFLTVAYFLMAFSSPFWVPLVAGFSCAFFWRQLPERDYSQATWIGVALLFLLLLAVTELPFVGLAFCIGLVITPLDIRVAEFGCDQGILFWNGRLGRQLLGDFSTRDET